jgi:hypothetical protein
MKNYGINSFLLHKYAECIRRKQNAYIDICAVNVQVKHASEIRTYKAFVYMYKCRMGFKKLTNLSLKTAIFV